MPKWTPVVIEGGKKDDSQSVDMMTAFEKAGLVTEDGLFNYQKMFENLEANGHKPPQPPEPVIYFYTDEFGEQHYTFT